MLDKKEIVEKKQEKVEKTTEENTNQEK